MGSSYGRFSPLFGNKGIPYASTWPLRFLYLPMLYPLTLILGALRSLLVETTSHIKPVAHVVALSVP